MKVVLKNHQFSGAILVVGRVPVYTEQNNTSNKSTTCCKVLAHMFFSRSMLVNSKVSAFPFDGNPYPAKIQYLNGIYRTQNKKNGQGWHGFVLLRPVYLFYSQTTITNAMFFLVAQDATRSRELELQMRHKYFDTFLLGFLTSSYSLALQTEVFHASQMPKKS